ncbi:MAG: type I-B CRISPR-associated protein Cas8b/Csh1 [Lachnospiraceae bacterium]|jgi:CRISPR-associated protein Csh1|nr:type I-B CRISPR-associated protein Cas8b/Csh1 [Lachnospiraceae bacterium]
MLKEILQLFEKEYKSKMQPDNPDFFLTKNHVPENGDYLILGETDSGFEPLETITIKTDKKNIEPDTGYYYYDFIQYADYHSKYLESNKAIADKNIHSNNYLTLFIKKENITNGKITGETLTKYYDVFRNPYKKYNKPNLKKAYKALEEKYGPSDIARINKIENWVKDHLLCMDFGDEKGYIKLFFYYSKEDYKKESEKYILTNLYNSADYNVEIDGKIYGVPNNNMALNAKKPYLEQKTRKNVSPVLITQDEVLLQKKFFDYLSNLSKKNQCNLYINEDGLQPFEDGESPSGSFTGYFIRIQKGMEPEIIYYDTVLNYQEVIPKILIKNYLHFEKSSLEYRSVNQIKTLRGIINEYLFRKCLAGNYFNPSDKIRISDSCLKRNILLTRSILFKWFYLGMEDGVWQVLKASSIDLIKNSILNGSYKKAKEQYNLYLSLKERFEGGNTVNDILVNIDLLQEKINNSNPSKIENEAEFFFYVGQLTYYFLTLSKAGTKALSLSKPILNASSAAAMKKELRKLFDKYNYSITTEPKYQRFRTMYSLVSLCQIDIKGINEDALIGGYLYPNMIYKGKEDSTANTNQEKSNG